MRVGRMQLARFHPETPDRLTLIRWYKCKPDALIFPHPHTFAFNVWDDPEVKAARVIGFTPALGEWDAGLNHGQAGREFHGDPSWFLYGVPAAAADVDGRCVQWGGAFRPALGLAADGGAFAASGAPTLALKAAFTELPAVYRAALALAAGWSDLTPTAGAALALAARGVEAADFAAAAAAALAAQWSETQAAAASLALAARWVESSGSYAATLALAAAWSEVVTVSAAAATSANIPLGPSGPADLPFQTILYDSIGGWNFALTPFAFTAPAAGVYQWGFSIQYRRSNALPQPNEVCAAVVFAGPNDAAGNTSNPPLPASDPQYWQELIAGQTLLAVGDTLHVQCNWTNPVAGNLDLSYTLWVEYLGPLPPSPVAAGGRTP